MKITELNSFEIKELKGAVIWLIAIPPRFALNENSRNLFAIKPKSPI